MLVAPAARADSESEAVGERVKQQYIATHYAPNLGSGKRDAIVAEAFQMGRLAANYHRVLVTARLTDQKSRQEYAEKLVKLDRLMVGRAESEKVFKQYQNILRSLERERLQSVVNGSSNFMFLQGQARKVFKQTERDHIGNFSRSIGGEPVFGGIILGNTRKSVAKCTGLKIVPKGNDWQLVFTIESGDKSEDVVYDQFTLDDLWSAYHVVRPTARMKKDFEVWDAECNLVHCEDEISGLQAALHPALACSPMGIRCIALEVASGEVFLKDPGKKFGKDLKIALQWHDAPSTIFVEGGKLRVVATDEPDGLLLRLRLIGSSDPALAGKGELPKDLSDEKKLLAALADILEDCIKSGQGYITAEQFDMELGKRTLRSVLKAHKNLSVDQKVAAEAVMDLSPDIVFVDRFARTLAVLNWAADQLGDKFPAWPKEAVVAHFPVVTKVSEARVAELCQLPLPPVEALDIPDRVREKGKEVWYALMNQGQQVGWAQGFVGPVKLGDGEVQTKRWLKTVVYARRLNADVVVVRENTVNTDNAGLMLATKSMFGTAAGPKLEIQLSGGRDSLTTAMLRKGKDVGPIRPSDGWSKDGVVYDSAYLALSGRGATLKKDESETVKSVNLENPSNSDKFRDLTITRLDADVLTFRYKTDSDETVITWDEDGFPTRIRELELRPTTETAARSRSAICPFMASALCLTPVEPPLSTTRGTARLKVSTYLGADMFPPGGDPEWKVIGRPDETTVVVENLSPLTHTRTGFRRLAAEKAADARKWLAAGFLADSEDKAVKAFARTACMQGEANTPVAKCAVLRSAVNAHIQGDYSQAGVETASGILSNPSGDCKHHAILLTALLRAEGIPARIVTGLVVNAGDKISCGHAWVEAHLDEYWHRLDSALYGVSADTIYLRVAVIDDAGGLDKVLKALTQRVIKKIEVVSVTPPAKLGSPLTKAKLTDAQQDVIGRLAFAMGRVRLATALEALSSDGEKPGDAWKRARELAYKLGVEESDDLPKYEGHQLADGFNAVLVCTDQSSGAERQSWEERFGQEAAAKYAVTADFYKCLFIRGSTMSARLLPEARKKLDADLKTAMLPARVQQKVLELVFDDPLTETTFQKVMDLLNGHFNLGDITNLPENVGKLVETLSTQPGRK